MDALAASTPKMFKQVIHHNLGKVSLAYLLGVANVVIGTCLNTATQYHDNNNNNK